MHLIFLGKKIWGNKFRMLRLTLSLCFPFNPWPRIESSIAFRCHVPWVSINLEKYPCISVSFMALILLEKMYVRNHEVILIPPITVQPHKVPPCHSCCILIVSPLLQSENSCFHHQCMYPFANSIITTGNFRIPTVIQLVKGSLLKEFKT